MADQCPNCGMNNPGTGPNCQYCGKPLPGLVERDLRRLR